MVPPHCRLVAFPQIGINECQPYGGEPETDPGPEPDDSDGI